MSTADAVNAHSPGGRIGAVNQGHGSELGVLPATPIGRQPEPSGLDRGAVPHRVLMNRRAGWMAVLVGVFVRGRNQAWEKINGDLDVSSLGDVVPEVGDQILSPGGSPPTGDDGPDSYSSTIPTVFEVVKRLFKPGRTNDKLFIALCCEPRATYEDEVNLI